MGTSSHRYGWVLEEWRATGEPVRLLVVFHNWNSLINVFHSISYQYKHNILYMYFLTPPHLLTSSLVLCCVLQTLEGDGLPTASSGIPVTWALLFLTQKDSFELYPSQNRKKILKVKKVLDKMDNLTINGKTERNRLCLQVAMTSFQQISCDWIIT